MTKVSLLRLARVCRRFVSPAETVEAVRDVSLTAEAGEFVCLVGASGSGKSTLINLIAGLDVPDDGLVEVAGVDVGALGEGERAQLRLESIGVVFQDHQLVEEFTAAENVALPLEVRGMPSAQALAEAAGELARVGLTGLEDRRPSAMSGGQRQRVGIARALAGGRRIILADEPTGALDSENSQSLFELLARLSSEGTLVIVCTHDDLCRDFADSVYRMHDGYLAVDVVGSAVL